MYASIQQQSVVGEATYVQGSVAESPVDNDHRQETNEKVEPKKPECCQKNHQKPTNWSYGLSTESDITMITAETKSRS